MHCYKSQGQEHQKVENRFFTFNTEGRSIIIEDYSSEEKKTAKELMTFHVLTTTEKQSATFNQEYSFAKSQISPAILETLEEDNMSMNDIDEGISQNQDKKI